jgi:hypothetical protein
MIARLRRRLPWNRPRFVYLSCHCWRVDEHGNPRLPAVHADRCTAGRVELWDPMSRTSTVIRERGGR